MLNRIITPLATLLLLLCGRGRLSGHIITVTRSLRWIFKYEGQQKNRPKKNGSENLPAKRMYLWLSE